MLSKKNRISKKKEIERIFKQGRSSFDGVLGVRVLSATHTSNRFVVVVSAKVSKKAVVRNLIKRRLSELCRINLGKLISGNDFFILALPPAAACSYNDLTKSLTNHFKKLQVI